MIHKLSIYSVALLICFLPFLTLGQEEHTHNEETEHTNTTSMSDFQGQEEHSHDTSEEHNNTSIDVVPEEEAVPGTSESVFASFKQFPNLHPLVVHFPIVLLLLAFLSQLLGLFFHRTKFSWLTLALLFSGFIGAVLASLIFHAHAEELPENVIKIFETHEFYGKATTWLAGIALFLKLISHFVLKQKVWVEIIVFIIITASAISVGLAGHLGSQMVHIENVGPQGNYLEGHEHDK